MGEGKEGDELYSQRQVPHGFSRGLVNCSAHERGCCRPGLDQPQPGQMYGIQSMQPSGSDSGSAKERTKGCEASPLLYNFWVNQPDGVRGRAQEMCRPLSSARPTLPTRHQPCGGVSEPSHQKGSPQGVSAMQAALPPRSSSQGPPRRRRVKRKLSCALFPFTHSEESIHLPQELCSTMA